MQQRRTRVKDHQHFAICEGVDAGGRDYKVWLLRNLIHYNGSKTPSGYDDAVYFIPPSVVKPQTVVTEPHPASSVL